MLRPVQAPVQVFVDALPTATVVLTTGGDVLAANPAARTLFGPDGAIRAAVLAHAGGGSAVERPVDLVDTLGLSRSVLLTVAPLPVDLDEPAVVLSAVDVTALRAAERELDRLITVDAVTGLPNRRQLEVQLGLALERHRRHPGRLAALHIDLDGLTQAADVFGRDAVAEVLLEVASRLHLALRSGDFAATIGTGRFVVVLEREIRPSAPPVRRGTRRSADDIQIVAERIAAALRLPFDVTDGCVSLVPTVGIAVASDEDDVDSLVERSAADHYRVERRERRARLTLAACPD